MVALRLCQRIPYTMRYVGYKLKQNLFKNLRFRIATVRSAWRQPNIHQQSLVKLL